MVRRLALPAGETRTISSSLPPGLSEATFLLRSPAGGTLAVRDPRGRAVLGRRGTSSARGASYSFVRVSAPMAGRWALSATPRKPSDVPLLVTTSAR